MMIRKIALALLFGTLAFAGNTAENFQVENIEVKGLQRVALGAALTHIPFNVGDTLNEFRISQSIKSLYRSGHFNDIVVLRDGNTVIYRVHERETIADITFDGNSDLKDDQLLESLDENNIRIGETLDKTVITEIEKGLEDFYHSVGKYNANITAQILHLPRNRVAIDFHFVEGDAAAIEQINIVGNELFSDAELLKDIELTFDAPWWNIMAQHRYQKQTLQGDIETIKSYYLDRGYLRYNVDSTQVSMTPDKKAVYIALNITEGEQYMVSDVSFTGDMAGFDRRIKAMTPLSPNNLYNGAAVTYTEGLISKFLGRYGYAYPKVVVIPEINDDDKTVKLTISVDPGKRIYVHRITFKGNNVTSEGVLRREMRQMEGAWLSNGQVESSKSWLMRLPYIESATFETNQIPGEDDLVTIDFDIKEQASGSFTAGVGYGSTTKLSLNAGIQQNNFLGTGNQLGLSLNTVTYSRSATLSFTDPYFTVDGVSLGGQMYYNDFDAGSANLVEYNNRTYGIGANLGFPISEYVRVNLGIGWKANGITRLQTYEQIQQFYEIYSDPNDPDGGLEFKTVDFNAAISRSTLNRGTFPSSGSSQRLSAKITTPGSDVQYFKLSLDAKWYMPLTRAEDWTILTRFEAGYGNGYGQIYDNDQLLPFWENYRAGGTGTLRGFETNIVGPKAIYRYPSPVEGRPLGPDHDFIDVSPRSVGGNSKILAGTELIFPTPFLGDSLANSIRTSLFIDIGNVWDSEFVLSDYEDLHPSQFNKIDDYGDMFRFRSSAGMSIQWLSPMGPMLFSFAKPLRVEEGDRTEFFSFNIGQTF